MLPSFFILSSLFVLPGLGASVSNTKTNSNAATQNANGLRTHRFYGSSVRLPFGTAADPELIKEYGGFTIELAERLKREGRDRVGLGARSSDVLIGNIEYFPKESVYVYEFDGGNDRLFRAYDAHLTNIRTDYGRITQSSEQVNPLNLNHNAVEMAKTFQIPIEEILGAWYIGPERDMFWWQNMEYGSQPDLCDGILPQQEKPKKSHDSAELVPSLVKRSPDLAIQATQLGASNADASTGAWSRGEKISFESVSSASLQQSFFLFFFFFSVS